MPKARAPIQLSRSAAGLLLVCVTLLLLPGCSRKFWRKQADDDTYRAVSEKLTDERWQVPRMDMTPDSRSRFFDPYDPDCEPLPPDDPAAHPFMHCANGKQGSKHWHKFGDALSMENPHWLEPYRVLLQSGDPVEGHAKVEIPSVTLRDSVDLSYIHSRTYQTAIEDVYLSALSLTLERYRLGTQFQVLGGGSGVGGGLLNASFPRNKADSASLQNGLGITQLLPAGANLAVNILNTITWNTSSGSGTATRLAWQVTQPFLAGGGRQVIMESLTQAERSLLYQVRTLARFRQTLFTSVTSDFLTILLQIQNIKNLENNIRLLEEQIEIGRAKDDRQPREVKETLRVWPEGVEVPESIKELFTHDERLETLKWRGPMNDEQRALILGLSQDADYQAAVEELIRWREMRVVSLSVAQLVTRRNGSQNDLENARRRVADLMDSFKISLGLPTNVQMAVDTELLEPFTLIDPKIVSVENSLNDLARNQGVGLIPEPGGADVDGAEPMPTFTLLKKFVSDLKTYKQLVEIDGIEDVRQDFIPIRELLKNGNKNEANAAGSGRRFSSAEERDRVVSDVARDARLFSLIERGFERTSEMLDYVDELLKHDTSEELIKSLDADMDGRISRSELPIGWSDLPRAPMPKEPKTPKPGSELPDTESPVPDETTLSPEVVILALRDATIGLRENLVQIAQSLQVVQVGLRVEVIALNKFTLDGRDPDIEEVVQIGLQNRHDLMNARAAVTDKRRAVEIAANALMSVMNLGANGTVDPDGGLNDGVDITLEFKAPINQVAERNAYRKALVDYQRERRAYMLLEDQVKQQIRVSWRQLRVSEERLEIDRQTVRVAALQYDNAALEATGVGQNNSLSLLNALDSVLRAQNDLVGDWITYETNRLNIFRDMGIMEIDSTGVWEDDFYQAGGISPIADPKGDFPLSLPEPTELIPQMQSE